MTRFSYAEYLSLFRSSGVKSHRQGFDSGARCENHGDVTAASSQEPIMLAIRRGDVQTVTELATSISCIQTHSAVEDWTALHEAAYYGQAACVKALLKVDKRTLQEQTALLIAANGKHLECVKCLLEAGADPDISNKNKETPLYKACENESIEIVRMILAFGGSVNQRCHRGWTALHEAVRRGNTQLCEALLQARAAIDATNAYGITALIEAARHGSTEIVNYLISKGANVNLQSCEGTTALSEACKHGHRDTVDLLLRHHADANKGSQTRFLPLHIAAQHGHEDIVSLLQPVTSRAKIRQSGITPLHLAAEFNQENVVKFLIKSGCDVNTRMSHDRSSMFHDHRSTALYCAVTAGNAGVVELLLKAGANPNLDPLSPLLFCEWISSVSHMAAPLITLLLDYVGNVQLCYKLIEQLKSTKEWIAIKEKASSPRPLMHLCRLKVREQVGAQRLTFLNTLPIPGRLLHYLCCLQDSTTEYTVLNLGSTHT
ncbi:hypothetical protein QTP70_017839 [Hemibagrus guttatus]|uniref:SOCS box domain-containing protein n=1 Tax=Hemibagrus guttatus TaxID=175788 RepID=A0AAE0QZX1_9TELE|nr:hypothetical protein QTP70_017839 [Hemibagrus guttatus]